MADSNRDRNDANGTRRQGGSGRRRSRSPVDRSRSRRDDARGDRRRDGHPARILVKNLPYDIKWPTIKDTFRNEVGDVAFVDVLEGPDGRSKGIAMIEFKNKDHAKKAIEKMHKFKIGDREIVVREERDRDRAMFERQRDGERGRMGGDMGRVMDMPGRDLDLGRGAMDMGRGLDLGRGAMDMGRGLDVGRGGLDMVMRGGMDLGRDLAMRGVDMGVGMGLSGVGGGGLGGGLGLHGGLGLGGGGMLQGSAGQGDISPEILARLGIEGPITNQVFVANLDYQVSRQKLKEVFSLAGNVVNAELKEDKNGKSRGLGIVQFEQPLEAVQAVSMFNGQVLFERKMMVRIDKVVEDKPVSKLPSGLKSIGMGLGSGGAPLSGLNKSSGLGGAAGLGGLGAAGLGAGGLGAGGLGAGLGMELGMGGLGVGGAGDLAGLGGIPTSMGGGMGLTGLGLAGSGVTGLGQNNAGLGGLGGSSLGLGLGDSLGSGAMGASKMDLGDNMGMSSLGGGSGMMGAGVNIGGMGGVGLEGGSRGGYEENRRNIYRSGGSRFDSPARSGGFDDRQSSSYDSQGRAGLEMGGRGGMEMGGGRGGMDMTDRALGMGRAGLEAGMAGRGGLELSSQGRFDSMGMRGLEGDSRAGYDSVRAGMGNMDMGGRGVDLDSARGGYDQGLRGASFDVSGRGGYDKGRGSDMGSSRMDGRGGGRQGQARCTVTVRNIPYNLSWQDLRDRFRDIGDVKFAEIILDQGRPSGDAVVRFGSEEDAMRAISLMDGTRMDGRSIRVVLRN